MTNQVLLIGRLGGDPEVRSLNNGSQVASFTVATEERWKDKTSGERKSRTEWHRVETFVPGTVKFLSEHVGKGDLVKIQGMLRTDEFTSQEGVKKRATKIVVGGRMATIDLLATAKPNGQGKAAEKANEDFSADLDDEIPF
jgi:single-strand DNA-binding protein